MTDLTNPLLHMQIGVCTSDGSKVCRVGIMRVLKRGATYADSLRECPLGSHGVCRNCEGERAVVNELMVQMCTDFGITMGELFEQLDAAAEEDAVGGGAAAHVAAEPAHFGGGDAVGGGAAAHIAVAAHVVDEDVFKESCRTLRPDDLGTKTEWEKREFEKIQSLAEQHKTMQIKRLEDLLPKFPHLQGISPSNVRFCHYEGLLQILNNIMSHRNGLNLQDFRDMTLEFQTKISSTDQFDYAFTNQQEKNTMVEILTAFSQKWL